MPPHTLPPRSLAVARRAAVIRLANKAGAWAMPDWILLECAVSAGVCLLALTK